MIKSVIASKNRITHKTKYHVRYTRSEKTFTPDNVPMTVINFIQTHPYTDISGTYAFKNSDALKFE